MRDPREIAAQVLEEHGLRNAFDARAIAASIERALEAKAAEVLEIAAKAAEFEGDELGEADTGEAIARRIRKLAATLPGVAR